MKRTALQLWRMARGATTGRRPGFTLVELSLVLMILATLFTIAGPRLLEMTGRMRLDVAASSFVADLNRARSEALKRNRSVFVAKTGTNSYQIEFVGARTLQEGATFGVGSPDTVRFAAFGPVTGGGATYPVKAGNKTLNVRLSVTGYARVQ